MPLGQSPVSQAQTLKILLLWHKSFNPFRVPRLCRGGDGAGPGTRPHHRAPVVHQVTTAAVATSEGLWSEKSKGFGQQGDVAAYLNAYLWASHGGEKRTDRDEVCACSIPLPSVATAPSHYRAQITRTLPHLFNSSVFSVSQRAPNQMWPKAAERHDHIQKLKRNIQCLFIIVLSSDRSGLGMLSILSPK